VPRLKVLYDVDGWAYHNEALALQKYAPADFDVSIAPVPDPADAAVALGDRPVDVVFVLGYVNTPAVREALQRSGWPAKLVAGWCAGFPRGIDLFNRLRRYADAWIINNRTTWEAMGRPPRSYAIPNGVDLDVYTITRPRERRDPKVLWTGSERFRQLKGYDDIMLPVQQQLRAAGIPCELLLVDSRGPHKRTRTEMVDWYNSGTVLVCASQSEGTPNPALEAAACGCTVVSTPVGNMPELIRHDVNGYLAPRDPDALAAAIRLACEHHPRLARAMGHDIQAWHWAKRIEFFDVFREVIGGAQDVAS
jgi:glycosyltransferase involved in cell wall biosynthesis